MIRTYQHGTVQSFVAHRRRQGKRAIFAMLLSGLPLAAFIGGCVVFSLRPKLAGRPTSPTAGGIVFSSNGIPLNGDIPETIPVTAGPYAVALSEAVDAWSKALGHRVKRPKMFRGELVCLSATAIACADLEKYQIYISLDTTDKRSVLMHEVGHLLGVPHISGDPLMDPVHTTTVEAPTEAAVALAKLHEKKSHAPETPKSSVEPNAGEGPSK